MKDEDIKEEVAIQEGMVSESVMMLKISKMSLEKGETQKVSGVSTGGVNIQEAPGMYQEDDDCQKIPGIPLEDDMSQEIVKTRDRKEIQVKGKELKQVQSQERTMS